MRRRRFSMLARAARRFASASPVMPLPLRRSSRSAVSVARAGASAAAPSAARALRLRSRVCSAVRCGIAAARHAALAGSMEFERRSRLVRPRQFRRTTATVAGSALTAALSAHASRAVAHPSLSASCTPLIFTTRTLALSPRAVATISSASCATGAAFQSPRSISGLLSLTTAAHGNCVAPVRRDSTTVGSPICARGASRMRSRAAGSEPRAADSR
mmetsp:Transcript_55652/g.116460  ORF Transcript_55652/g.116460 Transcript_55652/m.116460 type:complete len:216 (+) Transcript_55652:221-868(+)